MSERISSAGYSTRRPAPPGERENRYVRRIVRDSFEFEISRKFASSYSMATIRTYV
jgi:hypothetical protein